MEVKATRFVKWDFASAFVLGALCLGELISRVLEFSNDVLGEELAVVLKNLKELRKDLPKHLAFDVSME